MNMPHAVIKPFPSITAGHALAIAQSQFKKPEALEFVVHGRKPERFFPYGDFPDDPCWYVQATPKVCFTLGSSVMLMISRLSGKVLYAGSSCDEG